jgi:two-component system response regulator YesN
MEKNKQSWEMQNVVNELSRAIRVADNNLADEQLTWLQNQLTQGTAIPMIQTRMDCGTMAFTILSEAVSWLKEGRPKAHEAFSNVYTMIQQLGTIEELIKALKNFASVIIGLVEETRQAHHQTILHKAMAYIETHYNDPALSLERTASAANVSQSHLSFLFKKKTQSSFHKHVTKTRIERAMALLKENDFRTYEVAEMVGYSNAQYFSVSFKKYTGISPLQFKNKAPDIEPGA